MSLLTRGRAKTYTGDPAPSYDTNSYSPITGFQLKKREKSKTRWRDIVENILTTISAIGWGLLIIFAFSFNTFAEISALSFMVGNVLLIIVSVAKLPLGDSWLIGSPIELLFV